MRVSTRQTSEGATTLALAGALVAMIGACASGERAPAPSERDPEREAAHPDPAGAIAACNRAVDEAAERSSEFAATQTMMKGCTGLFADETCREAFMRFAREGLGEKPPHYTCAAQYCPILAAPKPALCAQDVIETREVIVHWPEFQAAVMARDLGLPPDQTRALVAAGQAPLFTLALLIEEATPKEIDLPEADGAPDDDAQVEVYVYAADDLLHVFVGQRMVVVPRRVDAEEFAKIAQAVADSGASSAVIAFAEDVAYEVHVAVMDALRTAGVDRVRLGRLPSEPETVAPGEIPGSRVAGKAQIRPDSRTQHRIRQDGRTLVNAVIEMCLDPAGSVASVELVETTGYRDYDERLLSEMRQWRYNLEKPIPVCTEITFNYRQTL